MPINNQLHRLEKKYEQKGGRIPFSEIQKLSRKKVKAKTKKQSKQNKKSKYYKQSKYHKKRNIKRKTKRMKKLTSKLNRCHCGTNKYTGKEITPRGLGFCEECIPLNVVIQGKDKKLYENTKQGWKLL